MRAGPHSGTDPQCSKENFSVTPLPFFVVQTLCMCVCLCFSMIVVYNGVIQRLGVHIMSSKGQ